MESNRTTGRFHGWGSNLHRERPASPRPDTHISPQDSEKYQRCTPCSRQISPPERGSPPARIRLRRHQPRVHACCPSDLPSPVAARMERARLGLFPWASHPADQEPGDARQGRDRRSSTDLELLAQLTSVDLQSGSSLVACDLVSHVAKGSRCPVPADDRSPAIAIVPMKWRGRSQVGRKQLFGERLSRSAASGFGRNAEQGDIVDRGSVASAVAGASGVGAAPFESWPSGCWRQPASAHDACSIGRNSLNRPRDASTDSADRSSFAARATDSLRATCGTRAIRQVRPASICSRRFRAVRSADQARRGVEMLLRPAAGLPDSEPCAARMRSTDFQSTLGLWTSGVFV
jgi:hypothetical protein